MSLEKCPCCSNYYANAGRTLIAHFFYYHLPKKNENEEPKCWCGASLRGVITFARHLDHEHDLNEETGRTVDVIMHEILLGVKR